ncbi:hypothetical protein HPB48_008104 [Haemaphysalis longicornis]|uniref:Reverse transcriptase n=1 Tax=Haemaphysalis longicornis TaxID=44386 RepID=A0A9J6GFU6_HAELO|nr:hypothetical protein HPB48_008104 [Haemaphysalis longicornis]
MIRNLGDRQVEKLTFYLNEQLWTKGEVPPEWKHSEVVKILKQGKPPGIDALRPIPLTSCLGKVFGRIVTK